MKVYVIDDDEAIIETITLSITRLGHDVLGFDSPQKFLKVASKLDLGCVILDYCMPGMDGLEVQKMLSDMQCKHAVILLTGVGDIPEAVTAMRAGAIDFLRKPLRQAALVEALERAESKLASIQRFTDLEPLSNREREVLLALSSGLSSKIIDYDLGISVRTVEMHRGRLLRKLNAPNTSAALVLAQQAGLLPVVA